MSRQFIKITSATNEDGNDMFNAICKDILHTKTSVVRADLSLPIMQRVTTKDLITLIQEKGLECEITVFHDPEIAIEAKKKEEVDNSDDPFKE